MARVKAFNKLEFLSCMNEIHLFGDFFFQFERFGSSGSSLAIQEFQKSWKKFWPVNQNQSTTSSSNIDVSKSFFLFCWWNINFSLLLTCISLVLDACACRHAIERTCYCTHMCINDSGQNSSWLQSIVNDPWLKRYEANVVVDQCECYKLRLIRVKDFILLVNASRYTR